MPKVKNAQLWERDPNDWYPEPQWCAAALLRTETFTGPLIDPCAGLGHTVRAGRMAGYEVEASDLVERRDLFGRSHPEVKGGIHYAAALMTTRAKTVVFNPPFKLAQESIALALGLGFDVAAFLQLRFIGSVGRAMWFDSTPLAAVGLLVPRPSCPPGAVWLHAPEEVGGGEVDFAWFVWRQGWSGPPVLKWMRRDP